MHVPSVSILPASEGLRGSIRSAHHMFRGMLPSIDMLDSWRFADRTSLHLNLQLSAVNGGKPTDLMPFFEPAP